jgi:hypothetical protein
VGELLDEIRDAVLKECKHFDRARTTFYTGGMEVKLFPEMQAKLDSIAAQQRAG